MTAASDARHQARLLVRLRQVRMDVAARALTEARAATVQAEAARAAADAATAEANAAHGAARDQLGGDLQEAERLLAVVDQARFRQSIATRELEAARDDECGRKNAEAEHRRTAIVARARHAGVEERAMTLARRLVRRREEREQAEFDDRRRRS